MESPRVLRYSRTMSDQELDAAITIPPAEVRLNGADIVVQAEFLRHALHNFYIPDRQIRKLLRFFLSIAAAHAAVHFPTDDDYLQQLYQDFPWGKMTRFAICLTGLGGVGKSELLAALERLLGAPGLTSVQGHRNLPLVPLWSMSLRDGKGLNALLGPYLLPRAESDTNTEIDIQSSGLRKKAISIPLLKNLARRRSWRDSVCIMTLDELQSMALGGDASAAATTLLLNLLTIGPELIYCANFSLLHKFLTRPHEDGQRLLSRPMVLHPLGPEDPDWAEYLRNLKGVAPSVLAFDPVKDAELIHRYTFGIKRLVVLLIVEAFLIARKTNRKGTVGIEELGLAYHSIGYAGNRSAVDDLRNQMLLSKEIKKHLWSPFPESESGAEEIPEVSEAIEAFETRIDDALLVSALPPALAAVASTLSSDGSQDKLNAQVVKMRAPKATLDQLIEGAKYLDN